MRLGLHDHAFGREFFALVVSMKEQPRLKADAPAAEHLEKEIDDVVLPTEFAVGYDVEADRLLQRDHVADRRIFHLDELITSDRALAIAPPGIVISACGGSRLPTTSARNGGLFCGIGKRLLANPPTMACTQVPDKHCAHAGCLEALSAAAVTPNVGINFQKRSHEGGATLVPPLGWILVLMWKCAVEVDPTMVLNADQCRAKADDCLDAARHALYLDQRRLYEEIAEQWLLLAEQMGQKTNGHNGGQGSDLSRTSKTGH